MVKKKAKFDDAMGEMVERICRQFCTHGRPQCGIVYCLSRNDCEKVATELQKRLAARLGNRTCVRCPDLATCHIEIVYRLSHNGCKQVAPELQKRLGARLGNRTPSSALTWQTTPARSLCTARCALIARASEH